MQPTSQSEAGVTSIRIPRPARIPYALTKEPRPLLSRTPAHELRYVVRTLTSWANHTITQTPHRKSLETSRT